MATSCSKPAEIGEVLEVEYIAAALGVARAEGRHADPEIALLAIRRAEFNLTAQRKAFFAPGRTAGPELFADLRELAPANVREAMAHNLLAGAIQQDDATIGVRGDQSAAHGMNDVFGEVLKVEQLLALFFEFASLAAKRLREQAGQVSDRQKTQQVAQEPQAEHLPGGASNVGAGNFAFIGRAG